MARRTLTICTAVLSTLAIAAALFAACTCDNKLTSAEKAAGWKLLFDGKTLNGWKATGKPDCYAVEDGTIAILKRGGGYLATNEKYGDFELQCDFRMSEECNSGIFVRWADLKDSIQRGMEIQVIDSYGKETPEKHACGALYDCVAPKVNAAKPAGEWNHVVITCKGSMVIVDLNGKRVVTANLDRWTTPNMNPDGTPNKFNIAYKDMARKGFIGLQDHSNKAWFKNIKIREL